MQELEQSFSAELSAQIKCVGQQKFGQTLSRLLKESPFVFSPDKLLGDDIEAMEEYYIKLKELRMEIYRKYLFQCEPTNIVKHLSNFTSYTEFPKKLLAELKIGRSVCCEENCSKSFIYENDTYYDEKTGEISFGVTCNGHCNDFFCSEHVVVMNNGYLKEYFCSECSSFLDDKWKIEKRLEIPLKDEGEDGTRGDCEPLDPSTDLDALKEKLDIELDKYAKERDEVMALKRKNLLGV